MAKNDIYTLNEIDSKLDDSFADKLMATVVWANEIANKVDVEHFKSAPLKERDKGAVEAIINSIINVMYYDKSKQNYLYLAVELSARIARKHPLLDGNKRTAFYTGILIIDIAANISIMFNKDTSYYVNAIVDVAANKAGAIENWIQLLVNELDDPNNISTDKGILPVAYVIWYNKSLNAIKITNSLFNK